MTNCVCTHYTVRTLRVHVQWKYYKIKKRIRSVRGFMLDARFPLGVQMLNVTHYANSPRDV